MKKHVITTKEAERFNPSFKEGLSNDVVNKRKEDGFVNVSRNPTNKTYLQIVIGNIFTFFNILMFVVAALLLLLVGPKVVTNLMFLGIIICNLFIGTIQECKSKHTIEKLKLLNDSKNKVRRNGEDIEVHPTEIVLDDVVILNPGDQIPVDGTILDD